MPAAAAVGDDDNVNTVICPGFSLKALIPAPFEIHYPYDIHAQHPDWAFKPTDDGCVRACGCMRLFDGHAACCQECVQLKYDTRLKNIIARANEVDRQGNQLPTPLASSHTVNAYCNSVQKQQRYETLRAECGQLRLKVFNLSRHAQVLARSNDSYNRLLVLMADKDVPRLRQLLHVALSRGAGPGTIVELVHKAAVSLYHARGWKDDPDAKDLAFLVLKMSGPRLLSALSKKGMLPSIKWIQGQGNPPRLLPFFGPNLKEVSWLGMHISAHHACQCFPLKLIPCTFFTLHLSTFNNNLIVLAHHTCCTIVVP